jgi:hypothetical protein
MLSESGTALEKIRYHKQFASSLSAYGLGALETWKIIHFTF